MIGVCLCESWRLCLCVSSQRKEECILSVRGSDPDIRFATFLWLYFLFLVSTSSFVGDTCAYTRPPTHPPARTYTHAHTRRGVHHPDHRRCQARGRHSPASGTSSILVLCCGSPSPSLESGFDSSASPSSLALGVVESAPSA